MAYTMSYNSSGQTGDPDTTYSVHSLILSDFAVVTDVPGKFLMTNVNSGIGQPEKVEIDQRTIQNVYAGTGIEPALMLPTKSGSQIRADVKQVWLWSDPTDPSKPRYALPVHGSISFTIPNCEFITNTDIAELVTRLLGAVAAGSPGAGYNNLPKWFRGAIALK